MNARHARYPFTAEAREAVQSAGVTLESVVQREAPAVERGRERVERALLEGTIESETPGRWDTADELLSYPIARVLVSLLGVPAAVEKYAAAEAATAHERFAEDLTGDATLRSVSRSQLSLSDLLEEFDLADDVRPERDGGGSASGAGTGTGAGAGAGTGTGAAHESDRFRVAVGAYLRLADPDWGGDWRLAVRELADGEVRVTRAELHRMLEAAVRERVAEGLPFDVRASTAGEAIADALADEEEALRTLLSDRDPVPDVGVVRPDLFPPCITGLLERAREAGIDENADGDGGSADRDGREATTDEPRPLSPTSAFTLQAFLADLGMDAEAVTTLQGAGGADAEAVATRAEYIADGSRSQYPPPSCETVQAYGDCPGPDERCETIASPLAYYVDAVADDEVVDGDAAGAPGGDGETNGNADADRDTDADAAPITDTGEVSRADDGSNAGTDGGSDGDDGTTGAGDGP
jgi:DNA primase large subunit